MKILCDGGCGATALLTLAPEYVPDGWYHVTTDGPPQASGGARTVTEFILDPACFARVAFPSVAVPGAGIPLAAVPTTAAVQP